MTSVELNGRIERPIAVQTSAKGNRYGEFILRVGDTDDDLLKITAFKDNAEELRPLPKGSIVKLLCGIRGREYNGKYYVDLFMKENLTPSKKGSSKPVESSAPPTLPEEDELPF